MQRYHDRSTISLSLLRPSVWRHCNRTSGELSAMYRTSVALPVEQPRHILPHRPNNYDIWSRLLKPIHVHGSGEQKELLMTPHRTGFPNPGRKRSSTPSLDSRYTPTHRVSSSASIPLSSSAVATYKIRTSWYANTHCSASLVTPARLYCRS